MEKRFTEDLSSNKLTNVTVARVQSNGPTREQQNSACTGALLKTPKQVEWLYSTKIYNLILSKVPAYL